MQVVIDSHDLPSLTGFDSVLKMWTTVLKSVCRPSFQVIQLRSLTGTVDQIFQRAMDRLAGQVARHFPFRQEVSLPRYHWHSLNPFVSQHATYE
jgi:hypothetical protein